MAVIFFASSDQLSFQHSSHIIGPAVRWLFPSLSDEAVHGIVVLVRKGAHLMEYAILGLLVWGALRQQSGAASRPWRWQPAGQTVLLVMLYAASDEFHQRFVPSREASIKDVLIDTTGAILALLFLWLLGCWRKRW